MTGLILCPAENREPDAGVQISPRVAGREFESGARACDTPREALAAALLAFCDKEDLLGASGSGILDRGRGLWLACLEAFCELVGPR